MYDVFRFLRAAAIISFIIYLAGVGLWFIFRFIVIPAFIFSFIMKIFSSIKIKKKSYKKANSSNKNKNNFIDAEYEEID